VAEEEEEEMLCYALGHENMAAGRCFVPSLK
jgi:hypothetical protein